MTTTATKYQNSVEREQLIAMLHDTVKQCQIRFGGKKELATEIDKRVSVLCVAWERVFQHGLRNSAHGKTVSTFKQLTQVTGLNRIKANAVEDLKNPETDSGFWYFVKEHLSRHELQRYLSLKNVTTDSGRGFAWLRSALNEHSLEKYTQMMLSAPDILSQFYEDWALMRDEEKSSLLPNMAAGLGSILFAISIDSPSLNVERSATVTPSLLIGTTNTTRQPDLLDDDVVLIPAVVKATTQGENRKEKKRKKKPAKIVTFDSEDFSSCSGSPASCLVSPQEKSIVPVNNVAKTKQASIHDLLPSRLPPVETELKSTAAESNTFEANTISQSTGSVDRSQRFSFDIFARPNSAESRTQSRQEEREAEYDGCGLYSTETNGFLSDGSELKEVSAGDRQPRQTAHLDKKSHVGNSEGYAELKHEQRFAYLSEKRLSDASLRRNAADVDRSLGLNSALSRRSYDDLKRSLPHSDSVTSNTSLVSLCSRSSNFMTCEADSKISLMPLNAEGKPIDFDEMNAASVDGDTSESYGSYDSHEMPYGDIVLKATHAVGEAEKALSNSFRRHLDVPHSSTYVQDSANSLADGLSYEDLKQALVMMMVRKDDAEDQNRRLQVALEAEKQTVSSLRKEIEDKHSVELQRQEKNAERNRALMRENELLKNQLKKYVGAVQLLRQGASVDGEAFSGISVESLQPVIPPPRSSIDYSFEASEYEKKLIQVAEMHGELMEFNEALQKQLLAREVQLKRVTSELISLRGPLPSEIAPQEVEVNVSSATAADNFPAAASAPALVNIWIPSAFLKGSSTDAYHVYQVYIHIRNEEWNIYRRYAEFFELHCKLKKKYPAISLFDFPPKKTFGKKDPKIVEVRRKKLETYLRHVIHHLTEKLQQLAERPSRQILTSILPFFGEDAKPEKTRQRTRRSSERSSHPSTLRPSSSSEALNYGASRGGLHQYMGL